MDRINKKYVYKTTPMCRPDAVVQGDNYRFTVLTDRLIRMEYNVGGKFEDRATQTVINRDFDVPVFKVTQKDGTVKILTKSLEITYHGGEFTKNSLSARFVCDSRYEWHFGENKFNLKGTARTLDEVNGECELEDGIMSRGTMTTLDDSKSLILADDGWIDVREGKITDIYLFAYREDYKEALKDYCSLTGRTPMIPRYALGNWWSRFYKYSQEEYEQLMLRFEKENIPFSVAVIDMDWHLTDIEPKYGSGWTGFTWNKELFPDHKAFLKFLEEHGMKATLNLHPAEGVAAHEETYAALAESMGVDMENEETVAFDIANPKFVENYFEKVLHPMEDEGVAFWWMDWQQGDTTKIPGLDPLWMLNHYHYVDMRRKNVRPMIFSRYSGAGSHRYPVGFSGDTIATWESLDFQPYFTANASNICYGWWSHDIGGHMFGYRDDEMASRWVQFGVFSPIMRLHSMCNDFQSKEPWKFNKISDETMRDFLRLRHKMIPYLYTMNYRTYKQSVPLIEPVYYECRDNEAYIVNRNEYFFGSEMLVAPITRKSDSITRMGNTDTYLPEGVWFDFFNSRMYKGGHTYKMYRREETMPVLVKAGGIIPLNGDIKKDRTDNPKYLQVHIFPGADNTFVLYEDDGCTMAYEEDKCLKTKFTLETEHKLRFTVSEPFGDDKLKITDRKYTLVFRQLKDSVNISVTENGHRKNYVKYHKDNHLYIDIDGVNGELIVEFDAVLSGNSVKDDVFNILLNSQWTNNLKEVIYNKLVNAENSAIFINELTALNIDRNLYNAIIEAVTADGGF